MTSILRKIMEKTDSIIERLSIFFAVLSGIMIVLMSFTATYGVMRRYVFKSPEPYSYELSVMFLLWTFVLAVAYLEKLDSNLSVDFFVVLLPKKLRRFLLNVISPVLGLVFCGVLTWEGLDVAMYSLEIGEKSMSVWEVPLFPVKIIIPIGYGLLCLVLIMKIIRGIYILKDD
jgi:TRAP-type C4-dicarboxylate transport system permease small subunit